MRQKIFLFFALFIPALFSACDSGDIYPPEDENTENTISAKFLFSGLETFPRSYLLIFGAFGEDDSPIVSVTITQPKEGEATQVSLNNIPEEATSVRLCISTLGRQPLYTFFEKTIDNSIGDIQIPETEINLLQYGRIQQQVFELGTCTSCHGITSGAANLKLGVGVSYNDLVNKKATKSEKNRVEPFQVSESFLIDILTNPEVNLSHPHTTILHKEEDIDLLKAWIEQGALEE